jgi:hypothetical protein
MSKRIFKIYVLYKYCRAGDGVYRLASVVSKCYIIELHSGINLTKEVSDLNIGNHKALLKGIKEDINKWIYNICSTYKCLCIGF